MVSVYLQKSECALHSTFYFQKSILDFKGTINKKQTF